MKRQPMREWFVETRYTHHFPSTWEGWLVFVVLLGTPWVLLALGVGK